MPKRPSEMNVRIMRILKTSYLEAGVIPLSNPDGSNLPDGTTILIAGHAYFPDQDRLLQAGIIEPMLETLKPNWIVLAGGMIHDDSSKSWLRGAAPNAIASPSTIILWLPS